MTNTETSQPSEDNDQAILNATINKNALSQRNEAAVANHDKGMEEEIAKAAQLTKSKIAG